MIISLNNRQKEFKHDSMTIKEIITEMKFTFPNVIVKLNGQLIKKPSFADMIVTDGDNLEVIHLISGG